METTTDGNAPLEEVVKRNIISFSSQKDDDEIYSFVNTPKLQFYTLNANHDDIFTILDVCRVTNILLLVLSTPPDGNDEEERANYISNRGETILTAIKAQGFCYTNLYTILFSSENHKNVKKRKKSMKYVQRLLNAEFPMSGTSSSNHRVYDGYDLPDYKMLLQRGIGTQSSSTSNISSKMKMPKYTSHLPRSYIVGAYDYNPTALEFRIRGYIRNASLHPNASIHIVNLGTFGIREIVDSDGNTLVENDDRAQPNGLVYADPDALEGEQNLIGFDDDHHLEDEEDDEVLEPMKKASDYQSAWMDPLLKDHDEDPSTDYKSLTDTLNTAPSSTPMDDDEDLLSGTDDEYLRRKREQRDEQQFPDEIEIKPEENARERLARYRSLKSFRRSYWDAKENLPLDYAKVFHFSNFRGTMKDVVQDVKYEIVRSKDKKLAKEDEDEDEEMMDEDSQEDDPDYIPIGTLITLTVQLDDSKQFDAFLSKSSKTTRFVSATSLLPHENKVSVLHSSILPTESYNQNNDTPIKSKDVLTVRCGWRTWNARPIFSHSNLNSDKQKMERYMPSGGTTNNQFCSMTFYGPVTYTPSPVLLFRGEELVASGVLTHADADCILLKRVVLTGYPSRIHKRWAYVKYMFYNPEDVKWFQPAGLYSKHGLQGNIMESVGDHGNMKCLFHRPVLQHDTVCLPLYKRVYPKFAPVGDEDGKEQCLVVL